MRKLTVVQVLPALESGGVERGTLEVAKYLVQHGHRSIVISAGGRMVEQLEREGSEHVTWDLGAKSPWTLRHIPRLRRFLQEQAVDILHVRSRMPAWICYLAWRGMDPRRRPRLVTTVHGPYSVNPYSAVMTKGERVIAVSQTIRDYILTNYPSVDPARISVIHRGVAPEEFPRGYQPSPEWLSEWQRRFPQTIGKRLITLPARITRWKGQEDFLEVMARLKKAIADVHGLIVGEPHPRRRQFMEELKRKVAACGLQNDITFTGHRTDLREVMAISSLVLSLSREPEAFGRTTAEALSLGVPVIGYNHGGVREMLSAILPAGAVAVGDVDAVVELARRWLVTPPCLASHHPFVLAAMLSATMNIYYELAQYRADT